MTRYVHCVTREDGDGAIDQVGWNEYQHIDIGLEMRDRQEVAKDIETRETHSYRTAATYNGGDDIIGYKVNGDWYIRTSSEPENPGGNLAKVDSC